MIAHDGLGRYKRPFVFDDRHIRKSFRQAPDFSVIAIDNVPKTPRI
jgi:hypothetical protein